VAAQLEGPEARVERVRGKIGELRVTVDGQDAYRGNPLWYPTPKTVLTAVRAWLAGHPASR
jgi:hypothetical protein